MNRHHCADCGDKIPNGQAHIRSIAFEQVAYCSACIVWVQASGLLREGDPFAA